MAPSGKRLCRLDLCATPGDAAIMLLTGDEYLESIRDGRRVYVGSERVDDVTTLPAFRLG